MRDNGDSRFKHVVDRISGKKVQKEGSAQHASKPTDAKQYRRIRKEARYEPGTKKCKDALRRKGIVLRDVRPELGCVEARDNHHM